jgi:eukaryotic-like serine/threonine-protein kinase
MIGTTVSHYTIIEKLGAGGMGVVYKAKDTKLNRAVALKFLPAHLSASHQDNARFLQEAQAAASLNHPNICTIYGIDEHDGHIFIAMELVEGETLRDKKQSFSVKQTVDIGVQIAEGLAAAHDKGIVHRDIKPENIMVRKDGIVQIMDFGLARLAHASTPRLTQTGNIVGTAGYMSPEQVRGENVDFRSDIFSLGILLYEMFAGQHPFRGIHNAALVYEITSVDPPPLSGLKTEITPEIDRIVMECLRKDPADRFQSSAEVAKELRRVRRSSDPSPKNSSLKPAREKDQSEARLKSVSPFSGVRWYWQLALIALGIGLSAVGYFSLNRTRIDDTRARSVSRFSLPLPKGCSLELRRDGLALSPDGRYLALIARQDSISLLYLRDLNQLEMKLVTSTAGFDLSGVFFSPDGQWLGFFANGKLMKLSIHGGTPVAICDVLRGNGDSGGEASWAESGDIVFMKEWGAGLWIVSSEAGSVPRPLTTLNSEAGERAHFLPRALPGGKKALFSIWRGGDFDDNSVAAIDLKSGEYHTVLNGGSGGTYLKSGHVAFMLGSTLTAVPFDASALKVTGEAMPLVEKVLMNGGNAYPYFAVSDDGLLVFAPGEVEFVPTIVTLVEHGSSIRKIDATGASFGFPLFSPDGNSLAVVIFGATFQMGIFDLQKNVLRPLTFAGDNVRASWLPDGSRISYSSNADGRYKIYTVATDGSSPPQKLFDSDANPHPSSWTHDSKTLAYVVSGKETGFDIWLYSSAGTSQTRPLIATRANESSPSFSPDDHWIAYVSDESGESEIYVQPFPSLSGRWRASTGGGLFPKWSQDGRHLMFQRNDEIISIPVTVTTTNNGNAITVGKEERFLVRKGLITFDLSPNGKTVVVGQTRTELLVDHVNIVVNWFAELKDRFTSQKTPTAR